MSDCEKGFLYVPLLNIKLANGLVIIMNISTPPIILILEDQAMVRNGMKASLLGSEPLATVHEAGSFEDAIRVLSSEKIDIAFLDLHLQSEMTGLDVLKYIRTQELDTRAMMLSGEDRKEIVLQCLDAGAAGYILKNEKGSDIFKRAINAIFAGEVFLPTSVFGAGNFTPALPFPSSKSGPESLGLTLRQVEVLYYLCQGLQNKVIAAKMGLQEGTIQKDYVPAILRKFGVARRTQVVVEVARREMIIPKPTGQ
jgi:two-component system, NarL family, nitrate/nitrite response regulator NarL